MKIKKSEKKFLHNNVKETPILKEIKSIKKELIEKYGNKTLIATRVGDFYEFFLEDAIIVSEITNLKLTKRNGNKEDSPCMCGIPSKETIVKSTIKKIVDEGYILGIIEQYERKNNKGKKEFYRKLDRIITPGTLLEDDILNNYTCIIDFEQILIADCYNGEIFLNTISTVEEIIDYIEIYKPKEIIFFNEGFFYEKIKDFYKNIFLLERNKETVDKKTKEKIEKLIQKVDDKYKYITSLYIRYILDLFNELPVIHKEKRNTKISPLTLKNLEILESEYGYSLYKIINKTYSNLGKRLLKENLTYIFSEQEIIQRHKITSEIINNKNLNFFLIDSINKIYDTENILGKINNNRLFSNDFLFLKRTILIFLDIIDKIKNNTVFHPLINGINIAILKEIYNKIDKTIKDEEIIGKDMFLKPFNKKIKELYSIIENKNSLLLELEEKEIKKHNQKIKLVEINNKFYFNIKAGEKTPKGYIKVRSLKSIDRYTNKELLVLEEKILNASTILEDIERKYLNILRLLIVENKDTIIEMNNILGHIDMFLSFTILVKEENYVIPEIYNETLIINMKNPIVSNIIKEYVPNDVVFNKGIINTHYLSFMNGGGKSTYLKGIGLNYVLFMIGAPVLAKYARMEILDNIFSRVGSADNVLKGESTFIRELNEVNNILKNCTEQSLVLIDEFGRGTDNHSGILLCSGVIKYLLQNNIKSVFSTHYHELEKIVKENNTIISYVVDEEFDEKGLIKFNYKLKPGYSNTSHGYEIAKLIGFKKEVLDIIENNNLLNT